MTESVHPPKVSFTYTLRGAGWARGRLAIDEHKIELLASYLTDALGDLVRAAAALASDADRVAIIWEEEPGSNEWVFEQTAKVVRIQVNHHAGLSPRRNHNAAERPFDAQCSTRDLCSAIVVGALRVLDEFGVEGYRAQWDQHDFPLKALRNLEQLLLRRGAGDCGFEAGSVC